MVLNSCLQNWTFLTQKKMKIWDWLVSTVYHPSYSGGTGRKITVQDLPQAKV